MFIIIILINPIPSLLSSSQSPPEPVDHQHRDKDKEQRD